MAYELLSQSTKLNKRGGGVLIRVEEWGRRGEAKGEGGGEKLLETNKRGVAH